MILNLHSPLFDGHKDLTVWKHTTFFLPYMVKYTLFTFIVAMEICIVTMETYIYDYHYYRVESRFKGEALLIYSFGVRKLLWDK